MNEMMTTYNNRLFINGIDGIEVYRRNEAGRYEFVIVIKEIPTDVLHFDWLCEHYIGYKFSTT
jgi:hypothetical protein